MIVFKTSSIGNPTALLGVGEVEGDEVEAEGGKRSCELHHERALLTGACAVAEDEGRVRVPGCRVDERRRRGARLERHGEATWIVQARLGLQRPSSARR